MQCFINSYQILRSCSFAVHQLHCLSSIALCVCTTLLGCAFTDLDSQVWTPFPSIGKYSEFLREIFSCCTIYSLLPYVNVPSHHGLSKLCYNPLYCFSTFHQCSSSLYASICAGILADRRMLALHLKKETYTGSENGLHQIK